MLKRIVAALFLSAIIATSLAACGGGAAPEEAPQAAPAQPADQPQP